MVFNRLEPEDEHFLTCLRVPLSDDQAEFDAQVLALTKVLVDSLMKRNWSVVSPWLTATKASPNSKSSLLRRKPPVPSRTSNSCADCRSCGRFRLRTEKGKSSKRLR